MHWDDEADTTIYKVVVNHEEQYSIWPAERENALGWQDVGKSGSKEECLAYIKEVWTDMRPLSLRKKMKESERQASCGAPQNVPFMRFDMVGLRALKRDTYCVPGGWHLIWEDTHDEKVDLPVHMSRHRFVG
jgi:MbtH protein